MEKKFKLKEQLILIVEDVAFNRILLREIFESAGFTNIIEAENGSEALEKTVKDQPKIVILDLSMPIMDGFEYCKKIRKEQEFQEMPIIVQTASAESDEKAKAFEAGATDFIAKPIDERELIARTMVHLEKVVALEELLEYKKRTAQELEMAKKMQEFLMPNQKKISELEKQFNISLKYVFQTSSETGGDFWGVDTLDSTKLAIYMADFAGHGVQAALNTFRIHTLMRGKKDIMKNPAEFLGSLNDDLKELLETGQYATMFYGVIDFERQLMNYATAACPGPIRVTEKEFEVLDGQGFPLGMVRGSLYQNQEMPIKPGMGFLLYSDALIETPSHETGDFMQTAKIQKLKDDYVAKNGVFNSGFHEEIVKEFEKNYAKNRNDDLTMNFYYFL